MARIATYAVVLLGISLSSAACVFLVITRLSPEGANLWAITALYSAVFVSASSASSIAGLVVRAVAARGSKREHLKASLRQGLLFGFLVICLLMLFSARLFNFWSAALLAVIFILLELYIQ